MNLNNGIIWCDLETTGLDHVNDDIIEICLIITNSNLKVIDIFERVIHLEDDKLDNMNDFCKNMHTKSNLLYECKMSDYTLQQVEQEAIQFLIKNDIEKGKCVMGGNSVHFDRGFIKQHMPELHDYFNFRNLDVSSFIMVFNQWQPTIKLPYCNNAKHRARNDIIDAIKTLTRYKNFIQS